MSLVEDGRPIRRTKPSTRRKIKYSKRSDMPGSCPTGDHRWSATQSRVLASRRSSTVSITRRGWSPRRLRRR